ncbi:MAG: hypothetical protein WD845_08295 [Pirellulales bacterium]
MRLNKKHFLGFAIATVIFCSFGATLCLSQTPGDSAGAQLTQSSEHLRATVLGVTKGVAFLEGPEPVGDGGRLEGSHPVEWLQVKVLVEMLDVADSIGAIKWELLTPEGQPFAMSKPVSGTGTGRASSIVESDLTDPRLSALLQPSRVPPLEDATRGKVLLLGVSGKLHTGKTMQLKLSFSAQQGEPWEEFLFELPVP